MIITAKPHPQLFGHSCRHKRRRHLGQDRSRGSRFPDMRFRSVVMASQDTLPLECRPYQLAVIDGPGLLRLAPQAVQRLLPGKTPVLHTHLYLLLDRELALTGDSVVKDDE